MGWIISMVLAVIVCGAIFLIGRAVRNSAKKELTAGGRSDSEAEGWATGGLIAMVGAVLLFFVWGGLHTSLNSVHQIQAGHVGVVKSFGAIIGQRTEGFTLIYPWQGIQSWDIRTQKIKATTTCFDNKIPECMEAFSSDTQDVFVIGTLNLSVNPEDVQLLARTIGPNYLDNIVRPRMHQLLKDTTVLYKGVDIAPGREAIRKTVADRLRRELAIYSITAEDFLIENFDFRPEFKKSIEDKVIAEQNALAEENKVALAEAQARQKAASAQGEADRLRIEAQGQAEANRLVNESLTPLLVQYQAMQKLSDNVQIIMLPAGEGIIIDPSTILGPTQR